MMQLASFTADKITKLYSETITKSLFTLTVTFFSVFEHKNSFKKLTNNVHDTSHQTRKSFDLEPIPNNKIQ